MKQNPCPENSDLLFYKANKIALEAFNNLKTWSADAFTEPLECELAEAWIEACHKRFVDPRGFQKEVREALQDRIKSLINLLR